MLTKVQRGLLLDVVVRKGTAVLELLTSEDEALLVGRDTLLVLDLRLHVVNGVRGLHLQGDRLTREGFDENLHTTTQTEDEMESRLLLDIVVGQGTTILELLSGENETLLVGWDALLILNLRLDVVDGIGGLDFEGNGFTRQSLDEDLHATAETKDWGITLGMTHHVELGTALT